MVVPLLFPISSGRLSVPTTDPAPLLSPIQSQTTAVHPPVHFFLFYHIQPTIIRRNQQQQQKKHLVALWIVIQTRNIFLMMNIYAYRFNCCCESYLKKKERKKRKKGKETLITLRNDCNKFPAGPTDLSTKSRSVAAMTSSNGVLTNSTSMRTSPLPHKLNTAEMLAVRQLVTGYRESAAFLLRSADELEQLLLQQHSSNSC